VRHSDRLKQGRLLGGDRRVADVLNHRFSGPDHARLDIELANRPADTLIDLS
jgi:hypothetical protein